MRPIPVSSTLSETSRDRLKICCDIKYRFCEERDSLFEKIYDAINFVKYNDRLKSSPVTGLECPRRFQEVKVPRFHDNGTG